MIIHLSFKKLILTSKEAVEEKWGVEVPIKKYHSKIYDINKEIKVGDYLIEFNKITITQGVNNDYNINIKSLH